MEERNRQREWEGGGGERGTLGLGLGLLLLGFRTVNSVELVLDLTICELPVGVILVEQPAKQGNGGAAMKIDQAHQLALGAS